MKAIVLMLPAAILVLGVLWIAASVFLSMGTYLGSLT